MTVTTLKKAIIGRIIANWLINSPNASIITRSTLVNIATWQSMLAASARERM
jgi:hypothetical protein